jgi:hypothetical protein
MLLGIAADLSAPPSSPITFREVCCYAKTARSYDIIAISPKDMISDYARWFKIYGLFDYVDDILPPGEIRSFNVEITGGDSARLTVHNLHAVLGLL